MRALLITTNELVERTPWGDAYPSAMMPLIDRPFIQHVVEYLVNQGVDRFDVVLCQYPEKIKALLGDGTRWGVKFQYHLAKEPSKSVLTLKCLDFDKSNEWVLLVYADRLCLADIKPVKPALRPCHRILYCTEHPGNDQGKKLNWSGWAQLSNQCCLAAPGNCNKEELFEYLLAFEYTEPEFVIVSDIIRYGSYSDIMAAHKAVLCKQFNGLMLVAREVEEGVWLSRNINLHPTVQIRRPVYIGQNCRIGKGVRLGPHTVIGDNCVIDDKTILHNAVILPGSYVGTSLELQDVLVDRYRLINIRLESAMTITENFIMGSLPEKQFPQWLKSIPSRLLAAVLLILGSPFFIVMAVILKMICKQPLFDRKEAVRMPAPHDPGLWRVFSLLRFHPFKPTSETDGSSDLPPNISWQELLFYFFPALLNIVRGHLSFVGVAPRTVDEIKALPSDWRLLYLQSKTGLISEALVYFGANPNQDELRVAETFYSVSASWKYDFKLLAKYFGQLVYLWPKPDSKHNEKN